MNVIFSLMLAAAEPAQHSIFETEKILIGIIVGLVATIFGMLSRRISKLESIVPIVYQIKADTKHIKANCVHCDDD